MKRKLLTLILLLATVFGIVAVSNIQEAQAANQPGYLYLIPNDDWKSSNARFAAYFFGNGETWVSMTKLNDDLYEVKVPTTKVYPNVIFCRMNPNASANNWNNKWNQTSDLTIPTSGTNRYTVKSGTWDKGGGTWDTLSLHLVGTMNGWDSKNTDYSFTYDSTAHKHSLTLLLYPGEHQFKVASTNTWSAAFGHSKVSVSSEGLTLTNNADDNMILETKTIGLYTIEFETKSKSTIKVTLNSEMNATDVNSIFTPFYNEGSYTKVTDINVQPELEETIKQYFHTGNMPELHRTTVYTPGKLVMTTNADPAGVGYKDVNGNMVRFHITDGVENNDFTVNGTSVENYYVTLHDFTQIESSCIYGTYDMVSGWRSLNNGVYVNQSADLIEAFRLFTAPMWIATDGNYFDFTHVTVEVSGNTLTMKLWVSATELPVNGVGGKLNSNAESNGTYAVFSQAVIEK